MAGAPTGNTNAKSGTEWRNALRNAMARRGDGDYRKVLTQIADGVIARALEGDKDAWKEVGEREDGKSTQTLAGDPDAPLIKSLTVELVKP